jgi:hypothetical protein
MHLPLRDALIPRLHAAFPDMSMNVGSEGEPLVTFSAKHADVGNLVIQDEGDELTVLIGDITHRHFGNYDRGLGANEKAESIASEVVEYLRKLFADEIEFFGDGLRGGARARGAKARGMLSKLFLGAKTYVWSGPLHDG